MSSKFKDNEEFYDDINDEYDEQSDEEDNEADGGPEQEPEEDETLKQEISEMPFEELLKLKDKLGTKVYNQTIISKIDRNYGKSRQKKDQNYKRLNKNRPQEISSKKRVNQFREVFQIKKKTEDKERRDPRFDESCGQFSQNIFDKTYSFLNDIKDKEIIDLKRLLKKTKNEDKRQELNYLLQRKKNQKIAEQIKLKKKEIETNIRSKLSEEIGTKNTFVNKSTVKRLELVDRFKQLKKSGKLKKYLEKKRKRNAMRERKKIPKNRSND